MLSGKDSNGRGRDLVPSKHWTGERTGKSGSKGQKSQPARLAGNQCSIVCTLSLSYLAMVDVVGTEYLFAGSQNDDDA